MAADKGRRLVDVGLFVLRLGIGTMFILHGLEKLLAGPDIWSDVGEAISNFGITKHFMWWGLAAAVVECLGGAMLMFGWIPRIVALSMLIVMVVATTNHLAEGDDLMEASHAIELGIVFLALTIMGGGPLRSKIRFKKKAKAPDQSAPAAPKPEAPPTPKPHVQ